MYQGQLLMEDVTKAGKTVSRISPEEAAAAVEEDYD